MSIDRPWLANYPAGVAAQIDVDKYASVPAVLEEAFGRFRDKPAFANFGRRLSYGQIDDMSRQFAGYLTGVLKLGKGDRIAIMMPNVMQYPIALFGALPAGLGDLLGFPRGALINFALKHIKKMVPAFSLPQAVRFRDALARGAAHPLPPVTMTHDDIAFLQYTGGTTGVAKGAMLTHGNMVANMLQADAWISANTTEGAEVIITALPLYHIFALTANGLV